MPNEPLGPEMQAAIWIARPPEAVWVYLEDVSHDPHWRLGVRAARWTSSPPHGVGSTGAHSIQGQRDWKWTAAEVDRPKGMSWDYASGMFTGGRAGYRLQAEQGGTRLTMHLRLKPGLPQRLLMLVLKTLIKRQLAGDLAKLKAILES
jgi:uncharacterized protein YndB with AHSA1/START domain